MEDNFMNEILKYQGLIQLPSKKPKRPDLFSVEHKECHDCETETKHEYVRDGETEYWRCQNCLDIWLHKYGIFIPSHRRGKSVRQSHSIQEIRRIFTADDLD